ncbi:MAG: hypothetical protein QM714_04590 [Nocardioides sp.]|uniref:hypothetical protein n=1 Tax=Nocardioides sp. TaxID=35761 RepID=UPI0039E5DE9B
MFDLFMEAAWQVAIAGLVLGVGLPFVFALGVRQMVLAGPGQDGLPATAPGLHRALGVLCFLLVALAVLLGLAVILAGGFGKEVSFEHIYPTLVPKG